MKKKLKLDYYYGRQGERNAFYAVPKVLCEEMDFLGLSNDAKLLYAYPAGQKFSIHKKQ